MEAFLQKHQAKITGVVSCFDRLLIRGYLPIGYPSGMESFLDSRKVLLKNFKPFALECSATLKSHAQALAERAGRPYEYLNSPTRKEARAREIATQDEVTNGLVCVFACNEVCQSFRLCYGKGRPRLTTTKPRCLCLYFYYVDREFGLLHIRLQTWFPFPIQIYLNGHEWLARKMDRHRMEYTKLDNAFVHIAEPARAQRFADRFVKKNFPRIFATLARRVNPLLKNLLAPMQYYWVVDQAEFATDILFKDRVALKDLYSKLVKHATLCFTAEDVLTFLGRKLYGNFQGEVLTSYKKRWPGARVKHRMKENWIKMYDKHGCVLRIETVINHPYEFRIRRRAKRDGQWVTGWFPMAKRISNLYRYAEVSLQANRAYLEALAVVDDPADARRILQQVCQPVSYRGRRRRGLNPLRRDDVELFAATLRGENFIHGFTNGDLAEALGIRRHPDPRERKRRSARISRLLQLLRAHGLIAKIPRTRRYRPTSRGLSLMAAALQLQKEQIPDAMQLMAA